MLTPHLWLKTKKIADQTPRKVYFSVSKTVAKKATDRNLLKRRSKAIVRKHITEFKKGYIYFFSFKKGADKASFGELELEILDLLKKSRILDF